jgi:hypothetical protein
VLEAMSMGRAIVTTDAPGCRETVIEGENGFLVPPRTVEPLAAAMERFLREPALIRTMGERSREVAEAKYDVRKVNGVIMREMGLETGFGIQDSEFRGKKSEVRSQESEEPQYRDPVTLSRLRERVARLSAPGEGPSRGARLSEPGEGRLGGVPQRGVEVPSRLPDTGDRSC